MTRLWRHIDRARLVYALRELGKDVAIGLAIGLVIVLGFVALQCIGGGR